MGDKILRIFDMCRNCGLWVGYVTTSIGESLPTAGRGGISSEGRFYHIFNQSKRIFENYKYHKRKAIKLLRR